MRHLDIDLMKMLESTVPPCDLGSVSAFRAAMMKYQKQAPSDVTCFQE